MKEYNDNQNAQETAPKTEEERQAIIADIMMKLERLGLFSPETK